jgi:hypothetical protein
MGTLEAPRLGSHDVKVTVESGKGRGSTFHITLPAQAKERDRLNEISLDLSAATGGRLIR